MRSNNQLFISGVCLGFGSVIRLLAIIENKDFDTAIKKPEKLCQTGIYSRIRHPSYAGSLLIFFGLMLFYFDYKTAGSFTFLMFLYFLNRAKREDAILENFDGFADYKNRIWGFCPYVV